MVSQMASQERGEIFSSCAGNRTLVSLRTFGSPNHYAKAALKKVKTFRCVASEWYFTVNYRGRGVFLYILIVVCI